MSSAFRDIPDLIDVSSDLKISSPLVMVDIDRDRASTLGINADQIESVLYNAYGSRQISSIYSPVSDYAVIMELQPKYQADPTALNLLYVRSNSGKLIPMNEVATMRTTVGPLSITHLGQTPSVTISFNLAPGCFAGQRRRQDQSGRRRHAARRAYARSSRGRPPRSRIPSAAWAGWWCWPSS